MAKDGHNCPYEGWAKAKLEGIEKTVIEIKENIKDGFKDQNGRIRQNEQDISFMKGSAKFWVIGIPFVISILGIAVKLFVSKG